MRFFSWKNETSSMGDPLEHWEFSEQPSVNYKWQVKTTAGLFEEVLERLDRIEKKIELLNGGNKE